MKMHSLKKEMGLSFIRRAKRWYHHRRWILCIVISSNKWVFDRKKTRSSITDGDKNKTEITIEKRIERLNLGTSKVAQSTVGNHILNFITFN